MLIITPTPLRHRRGRGRPPQAAPPPPPAPAVVVAASLSGDGLVATLTFDQPLALSGGPFDFGGGAIQFNDQSPVGVSIVGDGGTALAFDLSAPELPEYGWNVNGQPPWLATALAAPQSGSYA